MNYAQSLGYLNRLAEMGVKVGLDHTRTLAEKLGHPERGFPSVLVAGTNGKGSVSAMLASVLSRAGLRVGLYTSPHLVDPRERIRVGGVRISEARFAELLGAVRLRAEEAAEEGLVEGVPTHFEALTLLAFLHFALEAVDAAVLEVGMGGRWDCTNIVEPRLSLVTSVALDHEEWLGKGLRNVAREKAGILRPSVPALTSASSPEALEVLGGVSARLGAPLGFPSEARIRRREGAWDLTCPEGEIADLPPPPLPGEHQMENAALACRAALALRRMGWDIPDASVREGIAAARWPGRLQRVRTAPDLYLDGAHNAEGCQALARFARGLPRPRALVFAAMADKPLEAMASALFPAFDAVVATQVPMARCAPASEVALGAWGGEVAVIPDPERAVERALASAGAGGAVVVGGSLYLVGHLMASWGMDAGDV